MKYLLLVYIWCSGIQIISAQDSIHCYPTNWYTGMKTKEVQVMLHATAIGNATITLAPYAGVTLQRVTKADSKNYLFLDLTVAGTAAPGHLNFTVKNNNVTTHVLFPLKKRRPGNGTAYAQGVTSADFIYFLMPDRFSNGDPSNDRVSGLRDQSLNRDSIFLRHGGDLQGVISHLDYLQSLGVTTLWMTPVLLNDMPDRTEHGYAFTDHYTIEPRIGGETAYRQLSDELHRRGMKLIQDAVYNHVGAFHFFFTDQPMKDWFHQWPSFTQTSYKDQPVIDPHAATQDRRITTDGWFTTQMPDLNQGNPFVANFLIQHALWCIEEFGVDGWRIDTYLYNDLNFMNRCNKRLTDEYPKMTEFGENWVHGTANQAWFADNTIDLPFKSNLQGAIDFQCEFEGIVPALTQKFGWTEGVNRLYNTLSNDFLYKNPMRNLIFLDNHDMSRIFSQLGEKKDLQKMAIAWLLTGRGIPQLYYGTEILMKGEANPDGNVRLDFPGGWHGDQKNAFTGGGLTADEKDVQEYTRRFGLFRKTSSAIKTGKLMQFVPQDGVYVYFRYDNNQTVMCIMNTNDGEASIKLDRFAERVKDFTKATDIATGNIFTLGNTITLGGKYLLVLDLKR